MATRAQRQQKKRKWFSQKALVIITVILIALAVTIMWILSSLAIVPHSLATISSIIVTVIGALFTLLQSLHLFFSPDKYKPVVTVEPGSPSGYISVDPSLSPHIPSITVQLPQAQQPPLDHLPRGQMRPDSHSVFFVPGNLPSDYVQRPVTQEAVYKSLIKQPITAGAVAATAITGMGGLGKTVVARAICNDPVIRTVFSDGVLWATLGRSADLAYHQRNWIAALGGDTSKASSLESGKVELMRLVRDRALLFVLDDVWSISDAHSLLIYGVRCRTLVTTRDAEIVEGANIVPLELMTEEEAFDLLVTSSAGLLTSRDMSSIIGQRVGYLPLALRVVGALLGRGIPWTVVERALTAHALRFLHFSQGDVLATLAASAEMLPASQYARYRELVIFPENEPLVPSAVARLWYKTGNLEDFETHRLLVEFQDRSLIQSNSILHSLQYAYLRQTLSIEEYRALNEVYINTFGLPEAWAQLPDDDQNYNWRFFAWHLLNSGRLTDLKQLLTNATYLRNKMAKIGASSVATDLSLALDVPTISKLASVIDLGGHVLDSNPSELLNQVVGRTGLLSLVHSRWLDDEIHFELTSATLMHRESGLHRVMGSEAPVFCCALSADGALLLAGRKDGVIDVRETRTGQIIRQFIGHHEWINGCAFSPDGRSALTACGDSTLTLWDVATAETIREFRGHTGWVRDCAFSPDGTQALSASADRTLRLWDVATAKTIRILKGHSNWVRGCTFSPTEALALSASYDGTLRVWNIETGKAVKVLRGHEGGIYACAFSPDGLQALSASADRTLRLWDVATAKTIRVFRGHTDWVRDCAFSPDGAQAISASDDNTLRVWDVKTGQVVAELRGHTDSVRSCMFSIVGTLAISASADRTLRLWDVTTNGSHEVRSGHTDWVRDCAFSPDGTQVLSASADRTLRLWDVATARTIRVFQGHSDWVTSCAFSPDGQKVISASNDGSMQLWDKESGRPYRTFRGHNAGVNCCRFNASGSQVISASDDCTLRLWDVATARTIRVFQGHSDWVTSCAFSPDGQVIVSGSGDTTLRVWQVKTGNTIHILSGHEGYVYSCSISPNGRQVISASEDTTVRLWDLYTGRVLSILEGSSAGVYECQFDFNTSQVIAVSEDCTLRLWASTNPAGRAKWVADAPLYCCAVYSEPAMTFSRVIAGDSFGNIHFLKLTPGGHETKVT